MAPRPALGSGESPSTRGDTIYPMTTLTINGTPSIVTLVPTQGSTNIKGTNNGLYLYTFMITLLVLFSVSCGIVFRSCILRRRFRRRMQAAIDNGMILPNHIVAQAAGKLAAHVGEKPVLYDVYLDNYQLEEEGLKRSSEPELKPMSATVIPVKTASNTPLLGPNDDPERPVQLTRELASEYFGVDMRTISEVIGDFWRNSSANRSLMWDSLLMRPPRPAPPSPPVPDTRANTGTASAGGSSSKASESNVPEKKVALGIVIAMPDAARPAFLANRSSPVTVSTPNSEDDLVVYSSSALARGKMPAIEKGKLESGGDGEAEADLPDLALGVIEVDWRAHDTPVTENKTEAI